MLTEYLFRIPLPYFKGYWNIKIEWQCAVRNRYSGASFEERGFSSFVLNYKKYQQLDNGIHHSKVTLAKNIEIMVRLHERVQEPVFNDQALLLYAYALSSSIQVWN